MTTGGTKKEAARKVLLDYGWSSESVEWAVNPTPKQAKERGAIPIANVNPEQHSAIVVLHQHGWNVHSIGEVIPVPESEIVRVLLWFNRDKIIREV